MLTKVKYVRRCNGACVELSYLGSRVLKVCSSMRGAARWYAPVLVIATRRVGSMKFSETFAFPVLVIVGLCT